MKRKDTKLVGGTEDGDARPRMIAIKDIKTHPTFVDLLPISEDLKATLVQSMRANGYYESEPVALATWPEQEEPVLVDGHVRREAALEVGITDVPFVQVRLESEMAGLELAINLQTGRRATTDGALYRLCCQFDRLLERGRHEASKEGGELPPHGGNCSGRSASARKTAILIGCNFRKVEKIRKIRRDGWREIQEDVSNDRMSINRAYKLIRDMELGEKEEKRGRKLSAAQIKVVKSVLSEENFVALEAMGEDLGSLLSQAVEQFISSQGNRGR